jgi:serine/threonine protein kinase
MTIYCPNYRCHLPQPTAKVCSDCGTTLDIHGSINGQAITYQLTKVLQDSGGKIKDDGEYCWYELFQVQANGANFVIKMLIIVPDRLSPSNDNHISKVKMRFQREYDLLCKGLEGVCKGYEILDIPVGTEMVQSIVMEEVSGLNLEEYVEQNRPIDSQRALRWFKQLVKILGGMHENQIQHRDIKPSNIIISGVGINQQLKIIDLGIALDCSNYQVVDETEVIGTRHYLDPLYTVGKEYRNDSDFYSLGQTFIYLLTGKLTDTNWYTDQAIVHPPLDHKLKAIIQKMISPDINKRFKSHKNILEYLESGYWSKQLGLFALFVAGLIIGLLLYLLTHSSENASNLVYIHPICEIAEINCGTRIPNDDTNPGIQSAFEELSKQNIASQQEAVKKYESTWVEYQGENQGAELLIYLNNAKLQANINSSQEIFTLLVAVPRYSSQPKISASVLSGIAQVQKEYNAKNDNSNLHIAILKEPSDDVSHKKLRETIKKVIKAAENENSQSAFKSKFIGVIGHYSSQITFSVLDIYAQNEILLISPGASRSDIPNSKNTLEQLNYFARTINNSKNQAYETASWLKQLANNTENCGMLDIHLVYQEDDFASNSLTLELKNLFSLTDDFTIKNVVIKSLPYTLVLRQIGQVEQDIISKITTSLELRKQEIAQEYSQSVCKPKQIVAFFPGPHVTSDQRKIIEHVANIIPQNVSFMGNVTASIISDSDVQSRIKNTGFYSRSYTLNPYNILDFIPSYSSSKKTRLDSSFISNTMKNNKQSDILSIDWRQISSTDAARVFSQAITEYVDNKDKYKNKKITKVFHDIIKSEKFIAKGFYGNVQFDGYERRGTKTGTILKHIRRCDPEKSTDANCSSREIVAVPIGYRDPRSSRQEAENYQLLTPEDLVSLENKSLEINRK